MSEKSQAALPANLVLRAASLYLKEHRERVDRRREELIQAILSADQRRLSWRARHPYLAFLRPGEPMTREKAIQVLQSENGLINDWVRAGLKGGYWADRMEALKNAASIMDSSTNMLVAADDASLLSEYWAEQTIKGEDNG